MIVVQDTISSDAQKPMLTPVYAMLWATLRQTVVLLYRVWRRVTRDEVLPVGGSAVN